jgi:hypothetical protein
MRAIEGVAKNQDEPVTLVVGDCPTGVDAIATAEASKLGWRIERHVAYWRVEGTRAGPNRNQRMADSGIDAAYGFPTANSSGTWDCVRRVRKAGIKPVLIDQTGKRIRDKE